MAYNKEATKKLFDSIDNIGNTDIINNINANPQQALENFKRAVLEGANVNAFDDEENGNPLLICVIYAIGVARANNQYHIERSAFKVDANDKVLALLASDHEVLSVLKEMFTLLVEHEDININVQNKEPAYRKEQKTDDAGNRIFLHNGKEVIELVDDVKYEYKYVYAEDGKDVDYNDTNQFLNNLNQKYDADQKTENVNFGTYYDAVYEEKRKLDSEGKPIPVGNTPLHVAFMLGDEEVISALCRHPKIRSDIENHEGVKAENVILKRIEELKEKIRNDKSVHLTEKLALEKTIKDFEEQELRIKSKMEEIARNKGNSATVQNQEDKFMAEDISNEVVAEQQRVLDEIEEQQKKEDESIQKLKELKSENYDFRSEEGQELLTTITRDKSVSAKIIDVLFDQEILTTKITLTLLKKSISHDTNLLDLNSHFVKTAVERVIKSEEHGREGVAEAIIKAVYSTLTIIQSNKSANLHIKDLKDNISYLEKIVKSLKPLKSDATIKRGIDAFYDKKNAILKNKTRDGTQALNVQHAQPPVNPGRPASSKASATSAIPSLPTQPHGGGSMLTDDSLEPEQKMLHGSLRKAIIGKINDNDIEKILTDSNPENIQAVLSTYVLLEDDTYTTFLMFALEQGKVNIAEYIVKNAGGDVIKLLLTKESMMVYKNYSPRSHTALSYAREQSSGLGMGLVKMIEEKMRELGLEVPAQPSQPVDQSNESFEEELNLGASPLPTQGSQNQQGRTDGLYLREDSISSESSDDEDKHQGASETPAFWDEDEDQGAPKTPTFWDKNKGKIAVGTIGALLLIGGIITALVVANPIVVASAIAAAVLGAIMLVGALAKTTDKGEEILAKASDKLSGLFVSKKPNDSYIGV